MHTQNNETQSTSVNNSVNEVQGCGLGLDVSVSRRSRSRDVLTSRFGLVSRKIVNVSVSVIYVSCPRPIFGQILQTAVRNVNGL